MSTIQHRRNTAAAAASNNRVLALDEWGFETDTGKGKLGDGVTHWLDLPYSIVPDPSGTFAALSRSPVFVPDYLSAGRTPGVTDDTAGVLAAIAIAQSTGRPLDFCRDAADAGPYKVSDVIEFDGVDDMTVLGRQATLVLVDDGTATGRIVKASNCARFTWDGPRLTQTAAARTGVYGLLTLDTVDEADIVHLSTSGGSAAGLFTATVSNSHFGKLIIRNPKADGAHFSRETIDCPIDALIVLGAHDDAFAVVSVKQDGAGPIFGPCRGVLLGKLIVRDSATLGSAISFVGAQDCGVASGFGDNVPGPLINVSQANYGGIINPARIAIANFVGTGSAGRQAVIGNAADVTLSNVDLSGGTEGYVILSSARTSIIGGAARDSSAGFGVYDDPASSKTNVVGVNLSGNSLGPTLFQGTGSQAVDCLT